MKGINLFNYNTPENDFLDPTNGYIWSLNAAKNYYNLGPDDDIRTQLVKKLYKSNQYNVEVGHLDEGLYRLAAYYAMPDDYGKENPIEYTFDDKGNYKITFSIDINSSMPAIDFDTERHVGNRMFKLTHNIEDGKTTNETIDQGLDI